ncbi:MAG: YneF family protein [Bacilli bacterium]|nr:YneF family protein [Bacilli bacterium]
MDWNGSWFGLAIGLLFVGLVVGFLGARKLMRRELKKNPPINENMIRAMFMSMGRKPSEAQIRAVIQNMKNSQ